MTYITRIANKRIFAKICLLSFRSTIPIIVRMAKTTSVVASYSGLYEEGEVDHINCVWPVFLSHSNL